MRRTGVLLPISSLPSETGVGELGKQAYEWLDLLEKEAISIWQILPLNPVGYGNSPYQPYSSFAGDELYISLDVLKEEGLLEETLSGLSKANHVQYDKVREEKEKYLRKACEKFYESGKQEQKEYKDFVQQEWVTLYSMYRALKKANKGSCWNEWPKEARDWPETRNMDLSPLEEEIQYHTFLQYEFLKQWNAVKKYAGEKGIKIMGDVPFYVGTDSADVWAGKENFLLGADGNPTFIAGVPPDYFSATGQRWGNPIYDWDYMKKENYKFWVDRIGYSQKLFDIVRIDHFRAFDTFWKIPASCPTAIEGEWIEAPGYEVLDTLEEKIDGLHLVAEDLGMLRKEVYVLKDYYHLKGMKIIQFEIRTDGKYAFDAFHDVENMIIYTGTHDNATLKEWYEELSVPARRKVRRWLTRIGISNGTVPERLIRYTLRSKAEYAIIPATDLIGEGKSGRINVPGTVGSPNWEWKLTSFVDVKKGLEKYRREIRARGEQNND